jgi:hypothetical protein
VESIVPFGSDLKRKRQRAHLYENQALKPNNIDVFFASHADI